MKKIVILDFLKWALKPEPAGTGKIRQFHVEGYMDLMNYFM